jgi:hypothetical protein
MKKMKSNHESWNYCYELTKPGATIAVDAVSFNHLIEMFKEYLHVATHMECIAGSLNSCKNALNLSRYCHNSGEYEIVLSYMKEEIESMEKNAKLILNGGEEE